MNKTSVYATCNVCFKECSEEDLMDHVRSHVKKKDVASEQCCEGLGIKLKMLENFPKRFKCDQCHKQFSHESSYKKHLASHFMEKRHTCDVCDNRFALKSQLNYHRRSHFKYFECMLCESSFSSECTLRQHLSKHTGEKPFACSVCDARFSSTNYLRRHQRVHTPNANCHICPTCQQAFLTASQLRTHQHVHTGVKPYLCTFCQKSFTQRHNFNDHVNTHTGEMPYSCDTCGEKFYKRKLWRFHRALHTECFKCDVCEKVFPRKDRLDEHVKIHKREKSFLCSFCEKAFLSSSLLNRHLLVHTGKKSHQCDICQKLFAQSRYLHRHIQRHLRRGEFPNPVKVSRDSGEGQDDPSLDNGEPEVLVEENSVQTVLVTNDSVSDTDDSSVICLKSKAIHSK